MVTRRSMLALSLAAPVFGQSAGSPPRYRTELDHPRLLLPPKRARLLKRERERQSMRWVQLESLVAGKVEMPEKGFAYALYYVASESKEHGKIAIDWALSSQGSDLRQLALVHDWCQPILSGSDRERLVGKIKQTLDATKYATDLPTVRSRILAALTLTGEADGLAEQVLPPLLTSWWKQHALDPLAAGNVPFEPKDHLALFELFHVLRDNLDLDLRETAAKHFTTLPIYHLLSHYPAPFPAPENEYRIPFMRAHAEPDVREAVRSRAAALAMVAYDNNSQEMQFLQGWLIQDRYLMRSPYGVPYEFLWANPYQPGLSFHYLPNVFHDSVTGRLIIRSTWEDDAIWYFQSTGAMQMFKDGRVINLKQEQITEAINMGNTTLMPAPLATKFSVSSPEKEASRYYVIGLKPSAAHDLEVDDEELKEVRSDRGGVLELVFPPKRTAGVRLKPSPASA